MFNPVRKRHAHVRKPRTIRYANNSSGMLLTVPNRTARHPDNVQRRSVRVKSRVLQENRRSAAGNARLSNMRQNGGAELAIQVVASGR